MIVAQLTDSASDTLFFVHWDGIWSVISCACCRTTHPLFGIHFCVLLCQHPVVVSCPCCSLFRSQRPTCTGPRLIPGLSGAPGHDSRALHLCCCLCRTAHAVHSLFPAVGNPRSPCLSRGTFRGLLPFAFPAGYFRDLKNRAVTMLGSWSPKDPDRLHSKEG